MSLGLGGMVSDLGVTGAERSQQAGKGSQQEGQREEEQRWKEDFRAEEVVLSLKNQKHDRDDFRVTEAELRHVFDTLDANGDGKVVSVT